MRDDGYESPELEKDIPNKYVFIHVSFRTDFAATRFLLGVKDDPTLKFRAERSDRPMGFARYKIIKKIK